MRWIRNRRGEEAEIDVIGNDLRKKIAIDDSSWFRSRIFVVFQLFSSTFVFFNSRNFPQRKGLRFLPFHHAEGTCKSFRTNFSQRIVVMGPYLRENVLNIIEKNSKQTNPLIKRFMFLKLMRVRWAKSLRFSINKPMDGVRMENQ